ncbi:hypothetical protein MNEG_15477 [Monoraphidium neglectum]|uniref:Uncharacterized protein n=1 Tax=Monoraphidium neglectum TaxID=145388 RepID=A0A0D2IWX5_9CHLO|nr:hypothetical protein MNEG_15477 [Monoraphidium neglectum]KIY92487.1 hypothetical protein MNEG_15477 [Monoraphidium neglectum]|eukprot:XP_013891507.1 hypothetical protein MNEG_15477 [Monoraphidium neglectum]
MTAPTPSAPLPPECEARTRCLAFRAAAGAAAAALAAAAGAAQALRALAPWQLLFLWLAAEATFAFVWADKLRRFNARPADHRPAGHDGAATARRVFLQLRHHFAFSEAYLSPWFSRGAGASQ